jgi:propanol-preferring alcohol dehydrogenase
MGAVRAWVVSEPGPIDSRPLRVVERADPEPGPGEVRVRVRACGVCRTDLHLAEGDLPPHRSATVPGHEIVGTVDARGAEAARFDLGDRIGIAWLRATCGRCRWCRSGRENLCPAARFTGWDADGGYAEYAVVPEAYAYRLPPAVDDAHAARCCAPAQSATERCAAPSCRPAAGWASTGLGRRRTSRRRSRSHRERQCTCSPAPHRPASWR